MAISYERAMTIARSHHCVRCKEYSYKRVTVKPSSEAMRTELNEEWHGALLCGVCGLNQEIGIDGEGEILYVA